MYKYSGIISLMIGVFCLLMRLGYPALMSWSWLYIILPGLAILAIFLGCIGLSKERINKKPPFYSFSFLIIYIIYAFVLTKASIIINLPIEVLIFSFIVALSSSAGSKLKLNQKIVCSLGVAFGFAQFAISFGDIFFTNY